MTCELFECSEFLAGCLQADLKSLDFTEPSVGSGFGDAVGEIARDFDKSAALSGIDP